MSNDVSSGRASLLAGTAAATLVREEVAHFLAAPMVYLHRFVKHIGSGESISAEQVGIALEELERVQRLVTSLRAVPRFPVSRQPVRLLDALNRVRRDNISPKVAIDIDVAADFSIMVDPV